MRLGQGQEKVRHGWDKVETRAPYAKWTLEKVRGLQRQIHTLGGDTEP